MKKTSAGSPSRGIRKAFSLAFLLLILLCAELHARNQGNSDQISADLAALAGGNGDLRFLAVTYDDFDHFHGGLILTIYGTGKVEQRALRTKVGEIRSVSAQDLVRLVDLLRTQEAWRQKTPERQAVPDETRVKLTISYADDRSTIWEWYNDMDENGRISRIRNFMEQIAWAK